MPELPDIAVYLDCLAPRILGQPLERLTIVNPFVLRSVSPSPAELAGAKVYKWQPQQLQNGAVLLVLDPIA